jgi:hypothetical protein
MRRLESGCSPKYLCCPLLHVIAHCGTVLAHLLVITLCRNSSGGSPATEVFRRGWFQTQRRKSVHHERIALQVYRHRDRPCLHGHREQGGRRRSLACSRQSFNCRFDGRSAGFNRVRGRVSRRPRRPGRARLGAPRPAYDYRHDSGPGRHGSPRHRAVCHGRRRAPEDEAIAASVPTYVSTPGRAQRRPRDDRTGRPGRP